MLTITHNFKGHYNNFTTQKKFSAKTYRKKTNDQTK